VAEFYIAGLQVPPSVGVTLLIAALL